MKFFYRAGRRISYITVSDLDTAKCHRTFQGGRGISTVVIHFHFAPCVGSKSSLHLGCRDDCKGTRTSLEFEMRSSFQASHSTHGSFDVLLSPELGGLHSGPNVVPNMTTLVRGVAWVMFRENRNMKSKHQIFSILIETKELVP